MSIARLIEIQTQQAMADAKVIMHENVTMDTCESVRKEWHGRYLQAEAEHGPQSLQCMLINRADALINAAIAAKVGGQWPAPSPLLIYPQAPRRAA